MRWRAKGGDRAIEMILGRAIEVICEAILGACSGIGLVVFGRVTGVR